MNKQQVESAVNTGMELLGPKSEIPVPVRLHDGIANLKQLLFLIASGQLALAPTTQEAPPGDPPPAVTPSPNRKTRRKAAAKKRSKKVA